MEAIIKAQSNQVSIAYKRKEFKNENRPYNRRNIVSKFSDASRRRMLRYLSSSKAAYFAIGTLTYPNMQDETIRSQFKQNWRSFAERLKRLFKDDSGFSCFWFVEFQTNGRPHYHFFTNRFIEHGWLALAWAKIVCSGDGKHLAAGTSIEGFRSGKRGFCKYASKYSAKQDQKTVPAMYANQKGGFRFWGIVGNRDVVAAHTRLDDYEYTAFEAFRVHEMAEKLSNKLIYNEFGVFVWHFDNEANFFHVFREVKRVNKVLLQAEQSRAAQVYRERRG